MIELAQAGYELTLDPARGGSMLRFTWQGEPLLRETQGPGILDAACFPLVPWSNRIARGRFVWVGREIALPVNAPAVDPRNPLHGYGWLLPWRTVAADGANAVLELEYEPGDWPWRFHAEQRFALNGTGLQVSLALTNRDGAVIPAGLGLHPWFPRTARTVYRGLHRCRWHSDGECLPLELEESTQPRDWWNGAPVGTVPLDTVFTGRAGPLEVIWPERDLRLAMTPSANLAFTAVYVPGGAEWFCVEPVSHMTDAINGARADSGLVALAPGETLHADVEFRAARANGAAGED